MRTINNLAQIKDSMKYLLMVLVAFFTISCSPTSTKLKEAIYKSKENKVELEKLLSHYSSNPGDSLKLKAAIFLVENMPGHITLEGEEIDRNNINVELANGNQQYFTKKVMKMTPLRVPSIRDELVGREDIANIKADYLIHHIDKAFEIWQTRPWLESLQFDDFCEYLLPYRAEEEVMDYWIDSVPLPREILYDIINHYDDLKYSITNISNFMYRFSETGTMNYQDSTIKPYILDCVDVSLIKLFKYRALGIPCAIDYVPCWSGTGGAHHWLRIIDPHYKDGGVPQVYQRTPKIYRRTFSINAMPEEKNNVSYLFKDPFNRDVTDQYIETSDVNVECPNHNQNTEYAYLAVFHNLSWEPVAWGKRNANQITFKSMGREIVYLPVSYRNNTSYNLTYPLILDNHGGTRYLIPDKNKLNKVHLTRKYPVKEFNARHGGDLVGGYLLCANNKEFNDSILVHRINRNPNMEYEIVNLENSFKYRYWKYVIPGYNSIAELNFFDQGKIVKGKINTLSTCVDYENLSDGDPLTYFEIYNYIEIDFGKPVSISKIMLLPRNDGNGIYPGDRYELFYFDKDGWTSLGQQVATEPFLDYLDVPDNALLWLRNLSNGVEERIFTWGNGVVRFW